MKKLFAIILSVVLGLSLCACSESGSNSESVEDKVRSAVENYIMASVAVQYDTTGVPSITAYIDEIGENEYEVTGKVTVRDKYGDSYTGKYDAVVEYDPETDDCAVDCNLGNLYKD